MSLDGWKRASFLVGSESNVRQWEPLPGGSVPSFRALLFGRGGGAVCEP